MSVHAFGKRDSAAVHQSLQVFQEVSPVTVSIARLCTAYSREQLRCKETVEARRLSARRAGISTRCIFCLFAERDGRATSQ